MKDELDAYVIDTRTNKGVEPALSVAFTALRRKAALNGYIVDLQKTNNVNPVVVKFLYCY